MNTKLNYWLELLAKEKVFTHSNCNRKIKKIQIFDDFIFEYIQKKKQV